MLGTLKRYRLAIISLVIGLFLGGAGSKFSPDLSLVSYVYDILSLQYVDKDLDSEAMVHGAIRGILASLDDPYTRFMEPKNYSEMKIRLSGEFSGIGIQIGMRDDRLTVISPIFDTPAYHAGLKSGDKILSINDESTKGLGLNEAVTKIRGPIGKAVVLSILSVNESDPRDVTIVRDTIIIKSIEKRAIFDDHIGYLRYSTFENKHGSEELELAIRELQSDGADRLILDLRDNGGGLLDGAVELTSFFVPTGDVVHTVDRNDDRQSLQVSGEAFYTDPLVVLVNQGSASSSEIVAGALKDHDRAVIIGDQSFGKASVQNVLPLRDGSAVLYTIAKYLTPNGNNIHEVGISPNIRVKLATEDIKLYYDPETYSYDTDAQLQAAIQYMRAQ
ncbi:MAG: S41 family peptidase [bacterium]|nr:S41 family peptidase [bacterium]